MSDEIDPSKVRNPFDFANPVRERSLLFGRAQVLEEVSYYLDHALRADRPINLALMGGLAAGKTSLLNVVEQDAKERGFLVVRVELDESDAQSPVVFFLKLLETILFASCGTGSFGGLEGQTYAAFRNMVDALEMPADKVFCPFQFPFHYVLAHRQQHHTAPIPDHVLHRDLQRLQEEVARPILLLIDDCDVLAKAPILLQKMRSTLNHAKGYMFVFSGTSALFPVMDEVFSPIARQFKKLMIGPFERRTDTEECIEKPLESVGFRSPRGLFDPETFDEIHRLSGARPYEIQLICHVLFRRLQLGRARRMQLNAAALEEVRRELEATQDISGRPVLAAIRQLSTRSLAGLGDLCVCSGYARVEQLWFAKHVFDERAEWSREQFESQARDLERAGILDVRDGVVRFHGDAFDRLYSKYFARERGVGLQIEDMPYEVLLQLRLQEQLWQESKGVDLLSVWMDSDDALETLEKLSTRIAEDGGLERLFTEGANGVEDVYWITTDFFGEGMTWVAALQLRSEWGEAGLLCSYRVRESDGDAGKRATNICQGIRERASALGGAVVIREIAWPVRSGPSMVALVEMHGSKWLKERIGSGHTRRMVDAYTERGAIEEAVRHGEIACRLKPSVASLNNLGYLRLVSRAYPEASLLLERAVAVAERAKDKALPQYNLGIALCGTGRRAEAIVRMETALEISAAVPPEERGMACLLVPNQPQDGQVVAFEEVREVDLHTVIETALERLRPPRKARKLRKARGPVPRRSRTTPRSG